jgi:hypothetical protein
VGSTVVDLERGQSANSTRFMAKAWSWSESRVRRFLKKLKSDAMIEVVSDAHATCITICNYDKYQSKPADGDAPDGAQGDALATHSRRKREPLNQLSASPAKAGSAAPLPEVSSDHAPAETPNWHDSTEDYFWDVIKAWKAKKLPHGLLIEIGKLIPGDFDQLLGIAERAEAARNTKAYLGGIKSKLKKENAPPEKPDAGIPPWVHEARVVYGYPVEREGKYWRMAGALFDDDKIQVGN